MSTLSEFIINNVLKSLEEELINHAPEIQAEILDEVKKITDLAIVWVDNKLKSALSI